MQAKNASTPTPPVGVIESLSQGFETVAGHLVLLLLPVLLDLFLWVGPRVSFRPVINMYYNEIWLPVMQEMGQTGDDSREAAFSEMLADAAENTPPQFLPIIGMPSLMAGRETTTLPFDLDPPVWMVRTPLEWGGGTLLFLIIGLIIGSFYITLIAYQVQEDRPLLWQVLKRQPALLLQLTAFALLASLVFLALYAPFILLSLGLALLNDTLAGLAAMAGVLFLIWVGVFGIFTVHGMLLNRRGVLAALWDSVRIVQWNTSPTVILILIVVVVSAALRQYVWTLPKPDSWLVLLGIGGHSFISTGLLASTFVFFKDRYRHWREVREVLFAEIERQRAEQQNKG